MLVGEPPSDRTWRYSKIEGGHRYASAAGSIVITDKPWHIELRDARGTLLTRTQHPSDFESTLNPALPFSFIRRASDASRSVAAVLSLSAGEQLFGGGESLPVSTSAGKRSCCR